MDKYTTCSRAPRHIGARIGSKTRLSKLCGFWKGKWVWRRCQGRQGWQVWRSDRATGQWAALGYTGLYSGVLGCTGLLGTVMGCTGLYWDALGCTGLYWATSGCNGMYWAVPGCSALYLAVLGCSWMYWAVLGCTGLYWAVVVYTGVYVVWFPNALAAFSKSDGDSV